MYVCMYVRSPLAQVCHSLLTSGLCGVGPAWAMLQLSAQGGVPTSGVGGPPLFQAAHARARQSTGASRKDRRVTGSREIPTLVHTSRLCCLELLAHLTQSGTQHSLGTCRGW